MKIQENMFLENISSAYGGFVGWGEEFDYVAYLILVRTRGLETVGGGFHITNTSVERPHYALLCPCWHSIPQPLALQESRRWTQAVVIHQNLQCVGIFLA